MGDIKRKKKLFQRPRKIYDKNRIETEGATVNKYGLKNVREIWKAKEKVATIRKRAKMLISKSDEEKQEFLERLNKMGFNVKDISDVLALTEENWLARRLQTFVFQKFNLKPKQARQLITHKHVIVDGTIVNIPSFMITTDLENKISLKEKTKKAKEEVKTE